MGDGALPTSAATGIAAPSPILAPVESGRSSCTVCFHSDTSTPSPGVRNTWQRRGGTTARHPNACKSELLLAEPLVCLPYGARHEYPPLGEELGVLETLEVEGKCVVPAGPGIPFFAEPLPEGGDVLARGLVSNLDVRVVVEVREVGDLVPVAVVIVANLRQVALREDVMLVYGALLPARPNGEVLGQRRRAE